MSAELKSDWKTELGPYGDKILSYQGAISKIRDCRERDLRVVLAQGVFDVVHLGHLEYLRKAKAGGDLLFVGLENDISVRINKGDKRPFNNLGNRLEFLSQVTSVDFVFGFDDAPLYSDPRNQEIYVRRYLELSPSAIAVTRGDVNTGQKEDQASQASVDLLFIDTVHKDSTTRLLQLIGYE